MKEQILKALNWRYAVKIFDPTKKVSEDDVHTILESARLSPSSIGLEMWKFIVITNPEIRAKLREAGYGQPKITDASHLVLITYRTDIAENICRERLERTAKIQNQNMNDLEGLKNMINGSIEQKTKDGSLEAWAKMQSYIPLGVMLETAALLGVDSCPMEGFSNEQVDAILNLKEKNLKSATMFTLGYRGDDMEAKRAKVRRAFEEVTEFI